MNMKSKAIDDTQSKPEPSEVASNQTFFEGFDVLRMTPETFCSFYSAELGETVAPEEVVAYRNSGRDVPINWLISLKVWFAHAVNSAQTKLCKLEANSYERKGVRLKNRNHPLYAFEATIISLQLPYSLDLRLFD